MNASDAITIRWTPPSSRPRRMVFEPRSTGGYTRIEQEWTGEEWRTVGSEIVSNVGLESPAAIVMSSGVESIRGP